MNKEIKPSIFDQIIVSMKRPPVIKKVTFYRLMAISQTSWLWVRDSLAFIEKTETHAWMRAILKDMVYAISQWNSFSSALERHIGFFAGEEIQLIKSSETMWNLPDVLESISTELENIQKLKSKIKNAMTYPTMVLLFALIAVIVLLVKVMPTIVSLFPDKESLPGITKFMLGASDYVQTQWYMLIIVPVFIVLSYTIAYKRLLPFRIIMDRVFLKAPVISWISRRFNLYRFTKLLWDFYNAWVSPNEALTQISNILVNYHYVNKIRAVKKDIEIWLWFSESLEWSWLFDPLLVQIIWVGENTWNIWEVMERMSKFYREELDNSLEWLMKLVEPLLMAFIAMIVWVIVASIFLPMGDLIWNIW